MRKQDQRNYYVLFNCVLQSGQRTVKFWWIRIFWNAFIMKTKLELETNIRGWTWSYRKESTFQRKAKT